MLDEEVMAGSKETNEIINRALSTLKGLFSPEQIMTLPYRYIRSQIMIELRKRKKSHQEAKKIMNKQFKDVSGYGVDSEIERAIQQGG